MQQTVDVLGPVEEPLSPVSIVAYGLDSDPEELSDSEQTILYEQPQMLSQSQRPKRTIRNQHDIEIDESSLMCFEI